MKAILLFIFTFLFTNVLWAVPAERFAGESFYEAVDRVFYDFEPVVEEGNAYNQREKLSKIDFGDQLDFESHEEMVSYFEHVRDKQFIDHKEKMRRSSWMYPHDGCWLRADLMNRNILARNSDAEGLRKIFIFGSLRVKTEFASGGEVRWWYHVVPVAKIEEGLFVFDPAINSAAPTPLNDWILRQVSEIDDAQFSVCTPATFGPYDDCSAERYEDYSSVISKQKRYLNSEESNLRNLGFDVDAYLGDNPPWLSPMGLSYRAAI